MILSVVDHDRDEVSHLVRSAFSMSFGVVHAAAGEHVKRAVGIFTARLAVKLIEGFSGCGMGNAPDQPDPG